MKMSEGKDLCAYCRVPPPSSDEEQIRLLKKLMDKGNDEAFHQLAGYYAAGTNGMPQNWAKANELYLKAGELGCAGGYYNLGNSYHEGWGVERDMKKAKHYYELAAMKGYVYARYNVAVFERKAGNHKRAIKHYLISARAGYDGSLEFVKMYFIPFLVTKGKTNTKALLVTKDEYESTLRAYHERQNEMKSDMRDKAAASDMFWY